MHARWGRERGQSVLALSKFDLEQPIPSNHFRFLFHNGSFSVVDRRTVPIPVGARRKSPLVVLLSKKKIKCRGVQCDHPTPASRGSACRRPFPSPRYVLPPPLRDSKSGQCPPFFMKMLFIAPRFLSTAARLPTPARPHKQTRARCHMRSSGGGGKKLGNPRYERLGERGITRRKGVRCGRCPGPASRPHADAKGEHTLRRESRRRT